MWRNRGCNDWCRLNDRRRCGARGWYNRGRSRNCGLSSNRSRFLFFLRLKIINAVQKRYDIDIGRIQLFRSVNFCSCLLKTRLLQKSVCCQKALLCRTFIGRSRRIQSGILRIARQRVRLLIHFPGSALSILFKCISQYSSVHHVLSAWATTRKRRGQF